METQWKSVLVVAPRRKRRPNVHRFAHSSIPTPPDRRAPLPVFCVAMVSYGVKYGEVWFDFPFQPELDVALAFIFLPTMLNAFKWYKRSQGTSFDGWF
jgi:hypothetical protein